MKEKLVRQWIDELRSGRWTQGTQLLACKDDLGYRHCCLGVLNEIAGNKYVETEVRYGVTVKSFLDLSGRRLFKTSEPRYSRSVNKQWLTEKVGIPGDVVERAIEMNDGGFSFTEIADYLEGELYGSETPKALD